MIIVNIQLPRYRFNVVGINPLKGCSEQFHAGFNENQLRQQFNLVAPWIRTNSASNIEEHLPSPSSWMALGWLWGQQLSVYISSNHKPWIRLIPGCGSAIDQHHVGFMWRWGRNLKGGNHGCQLIQWISGLHKDAQCTIERELEYSSSESKRRLCFICRCRFWCAMHTNSSSVAFTHSEALVVPIPHLRRTR